MLHRSHIYWYIFTYLYIHVFIAKAAFKEPLFLCRILAHNAVQFTVDLHRGSPIQSWLWLGFSSMGRLRLAGLIKILVSLAEYWLFYRALLHKRPIIQSILQTSATPYRSPIANSRAAICNGKLIAHVYVITHVYIVINS